MAQKNKASRGGRGTGARIGGFFRTILRGLWAGVLFVWKRPIILSVILLAAAVFLFRLLILRTFADYFNCAYLINTRLGMPGFFCSGYDVEFWGSTIFTIPGLGGVMDPPLEFVRKVVAWSIVLFFAFLSLWLTLVINNLKAIIKLLTLNKEEWGRFMASLRTWLLIFVSFCLIFYFTVMR